MTKQNSLPLFFLFFLNFYLYSQTYSIKEKFDDVYLASYNIPSFHPIGGIDYDAVANVYAPVNLGTYRSGSLEALLVLYETTGDKAYLYKFLDQAIQIQALKDGGSMTNDPDFWTTESFYINGRIIAPMAHFVYIVFSDNNLYNAPIYNSSLYGNFTTFGSAANWLKTEVIETLTTAIRYPYWYDAVDDCGIGYPDDDCGNPGRPEKGFLNDPDIKDNKDACEHKSPAAEINKQAPWGVALVYAWRVTYNETINTVLAQKLAKLAGFYYDLALDGNHYDSQSNSYQWQHGGFNCDGGDMEDAGHATWDLWFATAYNRFYNELYQNITSNAYFHDESMTRFRNTFTKNIYEPNQTGFYDKVDGSGSEWLFANSPVEAQQCLGWSGLYKWDGWDNTATTPNVYDILMGYYADNLDGITVNDISNLGEFWDAGRIMGFANLVFSQWEKEYFNLTLKNRDVVYNQDFFAKNILTVEPTAKNDFTPLDNNPPSFADPVITTPDFIIESGKTCNLVAGQEIIGKPGFHAMAGSSAHAYIDPTLMQLQSGGDGMRTANDTSYNSETTNVKNNISNKTAVSQQRTQQKQAKQIFITPNPTSGLFTLSLSENTVSDGSAKFTLSKAEGLTTSVFIYNELGQVVYQSTPLNIGSYSTWSTNQPINQLPIDLSAQPKGIYFVKVQSADKVYTEKVIIQ